MYDEIARELDDIVDEERHAVDNALRRPNEWRPSAEQNARDAAAERNLRLDLMPHDLAGKVRELEAYDFESAEARQRFEQLMDRLREQLMQQMVDQMSEAMQKCRPPTCSA